MRFLFLLCPFLFSLNAIGQVTPGNVGTANLTAWFEPGGLTSVSVLNWTTTIPSGNQAITVSDAAPPFPTSTTTPPGDVSNYNMTIDFTGNTFAAPMALRNGSTNFNLLNNVNAGGQGTFFAAYYLPANTPNGHILLYHEPGFPADGIQFRNLGNFMRMAIGVAGGSPNATRDYAEDFIPNVFSYTGNRSSSTSMRAYERSVLVPSGGTSGSTGPLGLTFGIRPNVNTSAYTGYMHEFIFYNRNLSAQELGRVHTYLAIKYGVTLGNTGGGTQGDYIATNGTTIWDASVSPAYHHDICGLSRDDNEGLLQKQSHSFDDTTRIYLASLAVDNLSNTGSFASNRQSVLIGHNQGAMCETTNANTEMPFPINHRLEREWKVTNTDFDGTFSCDFKMSPCATCFTNPIELRLLVDDDGDFSNATIFAAGSGLGLSLSGGIVTVSGISNTHIPENSTRYITVATVNPCVLNAAPLTFSALPFEDGSVRLFWEVPEEAEYSRFWVERSADNLVWQEVEQLAYTPQASTYETADLFPLPGTSYYRLKSRDQNGLDQYSTTWQVVLGERELLVSPNPVQDRLIIEGEGIDAGSVRLFDVQGRDITERVSFRQTNPSRVEVHLAGIPPGVLLLRTPFSTRKIVKTHR